MDLQSLRELHAAVKDEAATYDDFLNCCQELKGFHGRAYEAFEGELSGAHALHDALLHERVELIVNYSKRYGTTLVLQDMPSLLNVTGGSGSDNFARAWLLAILSALIAQEEQR